MSSITGFESLNGERYVLARRPPLTPMQADVLELVRMHLQAHGVPPTRAELAKCLGFTSPNAAHEHLVALAHKGAIEIMPRIARGIRILWEEP